MTKPANEGFSTAALIGILDGDRGFREFVDFDVAYYLGIDEWNRDSAAEVLLDAITNPESYVLPEHQSIGHRLAREIALTALAGICWQAVADHLEERWRNTGAGGGAKP